MADTELYSINVFPGDGTQTNFEISFVGGYISKNHVKAYLRIGNAEPVVTALEWQGDNTVRVVPAPPLGSTLVVYRDTPKDKPLADFSNGAVLTEASLDLNAKQAVFIAAEARDIGVERLDVLEAQTIRSLKGGLVLGPGFVVVGADGSASTQNFLDVISTITPIYDDGTWGGNFNDDGAWG